MHGHKRWGGRPAGAGGPWGGGAGEGFPFGPMGFLQGMGRAAAQQHRVRRGDVRLAVLRLLQEQPMHGYQVIQELAERSEGAWRPSAGSVYPTLQMLADEGLVVSEETGGKKVFRLTEAGVAAAAEAAGEGPAPWEEFGGPPEGVTGYHESMAKLARAAVQVGRTGTPDQVKAAGDALDEARRKLYGILAED